MAKVLSVILSTTVSLMVLLSAACGKALIKSFNAIYLLNLHGSSRRTEIVPEEERDENVFDISQGVSILLCVKATR